MTKPRVGIAGMTHLGVNTAAAVAERGFSVTGYDPDSGLTASLASGRLPVSEPGLEELMTRNAQRLQFTSDSDMLRECDIVYVACDVPTDDSGGSDLEPVRSLIAQVSAAAGPASLLVILSQVPPGFTRSLGFDHGRLFYQVETLVFGRAVERALNPERFIVGCADPAQPLPRSYAELLGAFGCPVLPMRYESAELAKIAINCCLVASVSIANTLAELSEQIGADWAEITPALRLDARIGPQAYLAPGLGIAGGNLERDLATVCSYADAHGTDAGVVRAFLANSRRRRDWVLRLLHEAVLSRTPAPEISVLGLAYKAGTHSTRNSPSLRLIAALSPVAVRAHDPIVTELEAMPAHLRLHHAPSEVWHDADALVIMTPWPEYRDLDPADIADGMRGKVLIDPYGLLDRTACESAGLVYYRLGTPFRN